MLIKNVVIVSAFILIAQGMLLIAMGQPLICTCGYVKLWEGVVLSNGNSQHLTDWYTFTHLIHGFLFYFLLWLWFPSQPISVRFLIALGIEASWEVIENTPIVIQHYRQQALAVGYIGDSVINSLSDSLSMIIAFWFAWRFPWWLVLIGAIGIEGWLAYEIHDGLTLNIINLIHVFPMIKSWQMNI
jgi:hypothetical protein